MRNRLIISISDVRGTKSYNIHQLVKKSAVVVVFLMFIVFGASIWFINYLSDEMDDLKLDKKEAVRYLIEKEKRLQAQNLFYSMQIKGKVLDIEELSSKLDNIEEMIGIKKTDDSNDINRATLAEITSYEKMYMLSTIPNGGPLKETVIKSSFGYRIHPITKKRKFHRGIDLRARMKTEVFATADGVVKFVQPYNKGDFGRVVIISHNFGFETIYAHLRSTKVKIGDVVRRNQLIALSGNSGRSTGAHLHYEVRYASKVLDPKDYINWNLSTYETIFKKQRRIQWESLVNLIKEQHKQAQLL